MSRFLFGLDIRSEECLLIERFGLVFGRLIVFAKTWLHGNFFLTSWFLERIFTFFNFLGEINNIWSLIERSLNFLVLILLFRVRTVIIILFLLKASCFAVILIFLFIKGAEKLVTDEFITRFVCGIHEKLEFSFLYWEISFLE